jgi:hypothetical protein
MGEESARESAPTRLREERFVFCHYPVDMSASENNVTSKDGQQTSSLDNALKD